MFPSLFCLVDYSLSCPRHDPSSSTLDRCSFPDSYSFSFDTPSTLPLPLLLLLYSYSFPELLPLLLYLISTTYTPLLLYSFSSLLFSTPSPPNPLPFQSPSPSLVTISSFALSDQTKTRLRFQTLKRAEGFRMHQALSRRRPEQSTHSDTELRGRKSKGISHWRSKVSQYLFDLLGCVEAEHDWENFQSSKVAYWT